jgi:hypothetical protein
MHTLLDLDQVRLQSLPRKLLEAVAQGTPISGLT